MKSDQTKRPLISVIIPAFKTESTIVETVNSVLAQSYKNFEIIVVDDGSPDRVAQLIKKTYGSRVRLIRQTNKGLAGARNSGIRVAQGEYVAFLDSDDVWLPTKLARQVKQIHTHPDGDVFYTDCYFWEDRVRTGQWTDRHGQKNGLITQELIERTVMLPVLTVVLRRQAWDEVGGFDERLRQVEDYDLWLRLALSGHTFYGLSAPLALYRINPEGLSRNTLLMAQTQLSIYQRLLPDAPAQWRAALRHQAGIFQLTVLHLRRQVAIAANQRLTASRLTIAMIQFKPPKTLQYLGVAGILLIQPSLLKTKFSAVTGTNHRGMKRPRTILLARNAFSWQYGGAEKLTYNLAVGLKQRGWRPIVVTRVPRLIKDCQQAGITTFKNIWLKNETQRRWMPIYYLLYPVLVLQYVWLIWRYRIDLLVLGSRDDQIFGSRAATLTGRRFIWLDHVDMKGVLGQPFRFLRQSYLHGLAQAARVIAVSRSERSLIFEHLPKALQPKVVAFSSGSTKQAAVPLAKPTKSWLITFVGRVEADKGIYDLVEAARVVCAKQPRAYFWIVGSGEAMVDVRRKIKAYRLGSRVSLLGQMENVYEALGASDLFVYPSHHDAGAPPLAIAEALLSHLPVVATRVGGIPEALDDSCARLVPVAKPAALAAALLEITTHPKLYAKLKKGAAARARSVDFETIIDQQYLPLFDEVYND